MEQFTLQQVLTGGFGFCILIGSAGIFLKRQGLITFGKPVERRDCATRMSSVCSEHGKLSADITELKSSVREQGDNIKEIKGSVDRMLGYLEGRNGTRL